jgi:Cu/Ag efflux pump CusA
MVGWVIGSAVRLRRLVVAGVVAVLGLGLLQLQGAPVDVYPEFDGTGVEIQAEALGLSAQEVEQLITVPLEQDLLNGVPWVESIRSRSMAGLSAIDLQFEAGTDLYEARQMVQERMTQAKALPNVGTPPIMVQPTSSTSRAAMVNLRSTDVSLIEMSVLARWQIRPRLMSIPGVANVSIWGQRDRQLQVQVDPARLRASNVTLTQLIETTGNALWVSPLSFVEASTPGTGGFVETPNQRIGVQHISPITDSQQLADVAVQDVQGPPVRLGDVATVVEEHQPLIGGAGAAGQEGLMLVVERFPGADLADVTEDVEEALAAMAPGLSGITVDSTVFRPTTYLSSALDNLGVAVLIGLLLMVAMIGVLSLSWRVAVVTFGSVAVSLVAALYVLDLRGAPLTTMTVIGLAAVTALVIDDAVGDVAQIRSRVRERRDAGQSAFTAMVTEAVLARRGPLGYALVITLLALVPLLLLSGVAAAFARPALLTFTLAALASLFVSLVVTPTLAVLLLGGRSRRSRVSPFDALVRRGADRLSAVSVGRAWPAAVGLVLLAALAVPLAASVRSDTVLPDLQDRGVVVRLEAAAGTSLPEMNRITGLAAEELRHIDGIESAGVQVGRAIGADEVVDVDSGEVWLTIAEDADYPGTLEAVRATIRGYPGLQSSVQTYAGDQVAAAAASTGDDLVVRVYGQDFETLRQTADDVRQVLATVEGVISPAVQAQSSRPTVEIEVDLAAAQRAGLRPGDVRRETSTLISGLTVGTLYEQQAIFDVVVWGGPPTRQSLDSLRSLLIDTPAGTQVRLGDVARVNLAPNPTVITHDAVSRSLDITAAIGDRDPSDVAAEVTARLQRVDFPYEYRAEVVGDAVIREQGRDAILLAVAVAAVLAFLLLQAATSSWRGALVLFVSVPVAATGGLVALHLLGGDPTVGVLAAIGAVVAVALRQALVLVRRAQELTQGTAAADAMRQALGEKAPPALAAVLVTAAAFLPAAVMARRAGLEMLQPFAVTLLAGLISSTLVVLVLIPSLFAAVAGPRPSDSSGRGAPGTVPAARRPVGGEPKQTREAGGMARIGRSLGLASLLAASLSLTGCQAARGVDPTSDEQPATVETRDGSPPVLTLSERAEQRLGIQTAPAVPDPAGGLLIPYAALVYDADGAAWAFVRTAPLTYTRTALTAGAITGGQVSVPTSNLKAEDQVVTVGAPELVGIETGLDGEE